MHGARLTSRKHKDTITMATRASTTDRISKLRKQATATRLVANAHPEGQARDLALEVADALEAKAKREETESTPGHVLTLPSSASAKDVADARRQCAVQYRDEVFLPSWWESRVGLPNVLLRSSLFSAIRPGEIFEEKQLGAPGQYKLWASGPQLCDYDRRVFAACLKFYSASRSLSLPDDEWIKTSVWQMSKTLTVAYTANVHQAIRKSLTRLKSIQLRAEIDGHQLPAQKLIDLNSSLNLENEGAQNDLLKSSEIIEFRVPDSIATLFGKNEWSQLSEQALHKTEGLASWLVGFYSTHSKPHTLALDKIYSYSGSNCPLYDFRRRLKKALVKLQSAEAPEEFRISSFEFTKDSLLVRLASWK
jgi:hypothetical protein